MTTHLRRTRRAAAAVLAGIVTVAAAAVAEAQPRRALAARAQAEAPRPAPRPEREAPDQAEIIRLFDAYAVMQAQEALQLDDARFGPFVSRLRTLQDMRRRHVRQRNAALRELRRLLGATGNESIIRERLETLARLDDAAAADERKARAAIDELLDVRQQARFRVLEQQLELRRLELVGRARQRLRSPRP
jgi:hypothetical protein